MEVKKVYKTFRYQNSLAWRSGRRAVISAAGKPDVDISSPPEFKGEAGHWTPEDMFVAALNGCVLLTFVAYALHKGLEFTSYESGADGMLENVDGQYRFTEVTLRPRVTVKSAADVERTHKLLADAEASCLVRNSIRSSVKLVPEVLVG